MNDHDSALHAYEQALRHNHNSVQAMNAISSILRTKENFPRAVEYLQAILKIDQSNGEVWSSLGRLPFPHGSATITTAATSSANRFDLGHCFLMMEDLQQAYTAYQQALYHLRDPKVGARGGRCLLELVADVLGTQTLVWHWHFV